MPCRRRRTGCPGERSAKTRPRRPYRLLLVEPLESRHLLSILTVTTAADNTIAGDGLYSLREAILAANAADEPVEIGFEVPAGESALVISVESPLPALDNPNHPITIRGEGLVVLDGSGAGSSPGLEIRSDGNQVYGLEIRNFVEEGIRVLGSKNTIRDNAIYGNGGLSIDLGGDGLTPNDTLDRDRGPNALQNFPLLSFAETAAGNTTRVVGRLSAAPRQQFVVDFYAASGNWASSGNSVAERYLGSTTVSTDAAGAAGFEKGLVAQTAAGEIIVATATDESGNTSEFSRPVMVDELGQRIFGELSDLADELDQAAQEARRALTDPAFLSELADGIGDQISTIQSDPPAGLPLSEAIARAVNEYVEDSFGAERDARYGLDGTGPGEYLFGPDEYIVVWGNDVRFLLQTPGTPAAGGKVGYEAAGDLVEDVPGAKVFRDDATGVSVAVIPAEHAGELLSNQFIDGVPVPPNLQFLKRFDGQPVLANLTYTLELEGLAATNQAGVIAFGHGGTETVERNDAPLGETLSSNLDLSDVLTGVDMIADELNRAAVERVEEFFGSLEDPADDLLLLWFDPIDYLLADQLGRTSQNVGSKSVNTMPGSFYASNGFTELLVVPSARADFYTLNLVGLGQGYRGAANFFQGSSLTTALMQGRLGSMQNLWVQIDFRDGGTGSPFSGLAFLSQSGRFEEGRGISSPGIGLAETTILGESSKSRPLILASAGELGLDVSGFDDTGSGGQPVESENPEDNDKAADDDSGDGDEKPDEEKPKSDDQGNPQEQGTVGSEPGADGDKPGKSGPQRREVLKATDSAEGADGQGDGTPTSQQGGEGQRSSEGSGQSPTKGGTPTAGAPARAASAPLGRAESLAAWEPGRRRDEGDGLKFEAAERLGERFSAPAQDELSGAAVRQVMAESDLAWGEPAAWLVAASVLASGVRSQASRLPPR